LKFLCLLVEIDGKWVRHCIWLDGKHNRLLLEAYASKLDKPTKIESKEGFEDEKDTEKF